MKNIVLIGFMGAGKSTIAREFQKSMGMTVLEMDAMISQREGMSIPEIFRTKGEPYFRDAETALLVELQERDGVVVSCGGGTPMRQCNVTEMKKIGPVVLLWAEPETVLERVRYDHGRPLLEGHKDVAYIAGLLQQRRDKYEAACDFVVRTDGKSAETIAREILERI